MFVAICLLRELSGFEKRDKQFIEKFQSVLRCKLIGNSRLFSVSFSRFRIRRSANEQRVIYNSIPRNVSGVITSIYNTKSGENVAKKT